MAIQRRTQLEDEFLKKNLPGYADYALDVPAMLISSEGLFGVLMSHTPRKPPKRATDVSLQFEPLLDTNQAAALLQIHPKTLQRMARRGAVVGVQVGKLWRFRASELNGWLARIAG